MNQDQARDLDLKRATEHMEVLASKFDTVQIFATRYDPTTGNTVNVAVGTGNWYARKGQVLEWMTQHDEITRSLAMDSILDEEEDEEDE